VPDDETAQKVNDNLDFYRPSSDLGLKAGTGSTTAVVKWETDETFADDQLSRRPVAIGWVIREGNRCRASDLSGNPDVRFGSKTDIATRPRHVRFTPDSGHSSVQVGCVLL
jgi:hypothetical protein